MAPSQEPDCVKRSRRTLGFFVARQTCCQICGSRRRLMVDHKHDETRHVRGVLCGTCNTAVGFVEAAMKRGTFARLLRYIETDGEESLERERIEAVVREIRGRRRDLPGGKS